MEPLAVARQIVADRFPQARAAVLAGSAGAGRATSTSDLDIVVVLDGPPAPFRETVRTQGWLVELFVHTDASVEDWVDRERSRGSCTLAHMLATGVALAGPDVGSYAARARTILVAGPQPWTPDQIAQRRYLLSDALDDLAGTTDPDERDVVAGQVLVLAAELHLALGGHWLGTGKWLVRRLREYDPVMARRLLSGHRAAVADADIAGLALACDAVLSPLGGRLAEGYVVR